MEQLGSHWTDFRDIWYLSIFRKLCRENSCLIKIWQGQRVFYIKANVHVWQYLAQIFLEWEIFQTKFVETIQYTFNVRQLSPENRASVDLVLIKQQEAPYFSPAYCYVQQSSIITSSSVFMSIILPSAVLPAIRSNVSVTGWFLLHTLLDPSPVFFFCSSQNLLSRCLF